MLVIKILQQSSHKGRAVLPATLPATKPFPVFVTKFSTQTLTTQVGNTWRLADQPAWWNGAYGTWEMEVRRSAVGQHHVCFEHMTKHLERKQKNDF